MNSFKTVSEAKDSQNGVFEERDKSLVQEILRITTLNVSF